MQNIKKAGHSKEAPAHGLPQAPPLPRQCHGQNIFDCLVSGTGLLFFCIISWRHGANAFGQYAFFRSGSVSGALLAIVTALSAMAAGLGLLLLYRRIRHKRYCAVHFPKPEKPRGPSVWADMRDALDQMIGLKPYDGMENVEQAPAKKRALKDWFGQEKTRTGLSSFILLSLMYLTPAPVLQLMGQHVLMYYLIEFMTIITTLAMWLIAWVELGE